MQKYTQKNASFNNINNKKHNWSSAGVAFVGNYQMMIWLAGMLRNTRKTWPYKGLLKDVTKYFFVMDLRNPLQKNIPSKESDDSFSTKSIEHIVNLYRKLTHDVTQKVTPGWMIDKSFIQDLSKYGEAVLVQIEAHVSPKYPHPNITIPYGRKDITDISPLATAIREGGEEMSFYATPYFDKNKFIECSYGGRVYVAQLPENLKVVTTLMTRNVCILDEKKSNSDSRSNNGSNYKSKNYTLMCEKLIVLKTY